MFFKQPNYFMHQAIELVQPSGKHSPGNNLILGAKLQSDNTVLFSELLKDNFPSNVLLMAQN